MLFATVTYVSADMNVHMYTQHRWILLNIDPIFRIRCSQKNLIVPELGFSALLLGEGNES